MTTEQQFLKDVDSHVMEVIKDDGLYRHIRFREPGTMMQHFDLITWPGYLCYCGDMGTYVFTRLADMFQFFRTDREYAQRHGRQLGINLSYWAEKLEAVDGHRTGGSAMEFDEDRFREVVQEYRVNWVREAKSRSQLSVDERRELWEAVDRDVLGELDNGGDRAIYAAYDFCWQPGYGVSTRPHWRFEDLFEHGFQRYTNRFTWCCYALAWGIQKYDESQLQQEAA